MVGVFKPADIYPCSIDETSWTWDVSIESLFGRLCSGTNFAHDHEMISLHTLRPESQSGSMKSAKPYGPPSLDTLRQESGDLKATDDKDFCLISPKQSLPPSPVRNVKRHCPNTTVAKDSQKISTKMKAQPHYEHRLHGVRNSFGGWLNQLTLESERIPCTASSFPLVDDNEPRDAIHEAVRGTNKRSKEVTDDDPASRAHVDGEGGKSNRMNTGPRIRVSRIDDGAEHDTQISLYDSAFESQASLDARTKTKTGQVRHRKDAYRAAKGRSELSWENDQSLISTTGGHGIEETEL